MDYEDHVITNFVIAESSKVEICECKIFDTIIELEKEQMNLELSNQLMDIETDKFIQQINEDDFIYEEYELSDVELIQYVNQYEKI